jgi:excinuclease ABC subunit B
MPQIRAMYNGDRSRKDAGRARLPAAQRAGQPAAAFESSGDVEPGDLRLATPGPYELEQTGGEVVEQVIRPTGLVDPVIEVIPARGQVPHLLEADQASAPPSASGCW